MVGKSTHSVIYLFIGSIVLGSLFLGYKYLKPQKVGINVIGGGIGDGSSCLDQIIFYANYNRYKGPVPLREIDTLAGNYTKYPLCKNIPFPREELREYLISRNIPFCVNDYQSAKLSQNACKLTPEEAGVDKWLSSYYNEPNGCNTDTVREAINALVATHNENPLTDYKPEYNTVSYGDGPINSYTNARTPEMCDKAVNTPVPTASPVATATPPVTTTYKPSDLNKDGTIDVKDYNIFAANYTLAYTPSNPADINKNGVIDVKDFNIFVSEYKK